MKKYVVKVSKTAENDLEKILKYLKYDLKDE